MPDSVRRVSSSLGPYFSVRRVFYIVIGTASMVNFDSGGTAAILVRLSWGCEDDRLRLDGHAHDPEYPCLDQVWKGYLGSVPYVGLCCGCPVVGYLMARHKEKFIIVFFIMLNSVATFIFAFQTNRYLLVSAKFVIGFTQAAVSIYAPVWCSTFAPPSSRTLWFGLMQSAAAIGNLVGYAVCGYIVSAGFYYQWGFRIQAAYLALSCVLLHMIPSRMLNATEAEANAEGSPPGTNVNEVSPMSASRSGTGMSPTGGLHGKIPGSIRLSTFGGRVRLSTSLGSRMASKPARMTVGPSFIPTSFMVKPQEDIDDDRQTDTTSFDSLQTSCMEPLKLLQRPMFATQLFTQAALFFVVTSIQIWASEFFITVFHRDKTEVTSVFIFVSATAPILGVVIGSTVMDKLGTETADEIAKACKVTFGWGLLATLSGFIAAGIDPMHLTDTANQRFYGVVAAMWVQLFFGGAMLPAVSGMGLRSVPVKDRIMASGFAQLVCNIFGFTLGSLVPGIVSEYYGMRVAMQVGFAWATFGCIGTLMSAYVAAQTVRESQRADQTHSTSKESQLAQLSPIESTVSSIR